LKYYLGFDDDARGGFALSTTPYDETSATHIRHRQPLELPPDFPAAGASQARFSPKPA